MLLHRLSEIISLKTTWIAHRLKKCSAVCEYYFYNHNTDSVIPAIPKSTGFTGMLARLAKPSLLHSKQ